MRKLFSFLFFLFLLLYLAQESQAQELYKTETGNVAFFSEAPLENIDAKSKKLSAVLKPDTRTFAFSVPIRSFEFKKSLMQEHFNDKYLESEKYPKATFTGIIEEKGDFSKPGTYEVTAKGKLTIHGVTQDRTIKATINTFDGKLMVTSNFNVKVADHKIEIPKLVFDNIAEVVLVKVNTTLNPVK